MRDGEEDGRAVGVLLPAASGAGLACLGCSTVPLCGTLGLPITLPVAGAALLGPPIYFYSTPPIPQDQAWMQHPAAYRNGYLDGYRRIARRRRAVAALAGGVGGAAIVGAGVAVVFLRDGRR